MDSNWPQSLAWVRLDEGGNDDDPVDPGGRTSRGITQREYDAWNDSRQQARSDVWRAQDVEIDAIYKAQYWMPMCPSFPAGIDYLFFDMNVNMGFHEAAVLLQKGLGVTADGHIGVVTMQAIRECSPGKTIDALTNYKSSFYHQLRTWWKFGKGWTARYMRAAVRAKQLASKGASS